MGSHTPIESISVHSSGEALVSALALAFGPFGLVSPGTTWSLVSLCQRPWLHLLWGGVHQSISLALLFSLRGKVDVASISGFLSLGFVHTAPLKSASRLPRFP